MFDFISGVVSGVTTIVGAVVDFIIGGKDDTSGEPDPCDVGSCLEAKKRLTAARGDFQGVCHTIGLLKGMLYVPELIVSRSIFEYAVGVILLTLIFGAMGIFIAIGMYVTSWLIIQGMMPALQEAAKTMQLAIENEQMALNEVYYKCPEACHGDLEPSECIHLQETEDGLL